MIVMSRWIPEDKNIKINEKMILGTTIMSLGDLKGYVVQTMLSGLAITSRKVQTFEEAVQIESEIWAEVSK